MSKPKDDDDVSLFRKVVTGTRPLKQAARITRHKSQPAPKPRPAPTAMQTPSSSFVATEYIAPTTPQESLLFSEPGLRPRQLQRLKRGDIPIEASLDLHGMTTPHAGDALSEFLQHAREMNWQCVLIIHGKGQRSEAGRPVLKSQLNHWLRQNSAVLAFSSARPRDGGTGAVYVLLRRS